MKKSTKDIIKRMQAKGWHLDTHSTILSRRHEGHRTIAGLRFVKPLKQIRK